MGILFTKILECDIKLNIFGRSLKPKNGILNFEDNPDKSEYVSFDDITKI